MSKELASVSFCAFSPHFYGISMVLLARARGKGSSEVPLLEVVVVSGINRLRLIRDRHRLRLPTDIGLTKFVSHFNQLFIPIVFYVCLYYVSAREAKKKNRMRSAEALFVPMVLVGRDWVDLINMHIHARK